MSLIASIALVGAQAGLPPVPPPPSEFEVGLANELAAALVRSDFAKANGLVTENVQVARTAKYPGSKDFEVEFSGRGRQAFTDQARFLIKKLGSPSSASCIATASICKFTFNASGRVLLAGMVTRNHRVEFVQFIYMTREMALKRLGGKG